MNKIIQIVGIPATGKSYLLRRIQIPQINYLDFGPEFKKWLDGKMPSSEDIKKGGADRYVRDFVDLILERRVPCVFTSHLVQFRGGKFFYDEDLELYTSTAGYVCVLSSPEEILRRRQRDNKDRRKLRDEDNLEVIAAHQDYTQRLVDYFVKRIGSQIIYITNDLLLESENIERLKEFTKEVLIS